MNKKTKHEKENKISYETRFKGTYQISVMQSKTVANIMKVINTRDSEKKTKHIKELNLLFDEALSKMGSRLSVEWYNPRGIITGVKGNRTNHPTNAYKEALEKNLKKLEGMRAMGDSTSTVDGEAI